PTIFTAVFYASLLKSIYYFGRIITAIMNIKQAGKYLFTKAIDTYFFDLHKAFQFVLRFFKEALKPPFEFKEIIRQCYEVGYKSLPLITLTGFVTGLVFTKQSRPSL